MAVEQAAGKGGDDVIRGVRTDAGGAADAMTMLACECAGRVANFVVNGGEWVMAEGIENGSGCDGEINGADASFAAGADPFPTTKAAVPVFFSATPSWHMQELLILMSALAHTFSNFA